MRASWLLLFALSAQAARPTRISVVVTDGAGQPVPDAVVVIPIEGERHRVNSVDGSFASGALYPKDGTEQVLAKGEVVHLVAAAPGYAPAKAERELSAKGNAVTVVLEPVAAPALACLPEGMSLDPANGEAVSTWAEGELAVEGERSAEAGWCLLGARSYGAWLAWQVKSDAYRAEGSMDSARADAAAQRRTYETSKEWLEWSTANGADAAVAGVLCQVASHALEPCL